MTNSSEPYTRSSPRTQLKRDTEWKALKQKPKTLKPKTETPEWEKTHLQNYTQIKTLGRETCGSDTKNLTVPATAVGVWGSRDLGFEGLKDSGLRV